MGGAEAAGKKIQATHGHAPRRAFKLNIYATDLTPSGRLSREHCRARVLGQKSQITNSCTAFSCGTTTATDHNLYVAKHKKGDYIYEANYRAGLQILRVDDYSTADFVEVGRFDTYPDDDSSDFAGAWSVYPYFKSGLLAVSSIEEGLFLVKRSEPKRRLRGAHP